MCAFSGWSLYIPVVPSFLLEVTTEVVPSFEQMLTNTGGTVICAGVHYITGTAVVFKTGHYIPHAGSSVVYPSSHCTQRQCSRLCWRLLRTGSNVSSAGGHYTATSVLQAVTTQQLSSAGGHYTATSVLQAVTTRPRQFCRRSLHRNVSSAGGHYTATSVL